MITANFPMDVRETVNNPEHWELGSIVTHMTDRELEEAIVTDVLAVTMWEYESGLEMTWGYSDLVKWIPRQYYRKILQAMCRTHRSGLIDLTERGLRIHADKLNEAMNFCGVYYDLQS